MLKQEIISWLMRAIEHSKRVKESDRQMAETIFRLLHVELGCLELKDYEEIYLGKYCKFCGDKPCGKPWCWKNDK